MVFVLYRVLMAAYAIFAFTHMLVVTDSGPRVMAFLTVWTYLVEMLFFFLGALLAVIFFLRPGHFSDRGHREVEGVDNLTYDHTNTAFDHVADARAHKNGVTSNTASSNGVFSIEAQSLSDVKQNGVSTLAHQDTVCSLPWYIQVYWFLANVIQVFALVVTIIYFGALYPSQDTGHIPFFNINVHGISSVMLVIDMAVCARPVRLLHFPYPALYGTVYVIFSVIFWSQDHANNVLYPNVLDWNHPGISTGVVCGLAVVGIPLLQLFNFGLYKLRLLTYRKIYGQSYL